MLFRSGFDLSARVDAIRHSLGEAPDDYDTVTFPMVDLACREDLSWLLGLELGDSSGQQWTVSQALQQTRFQMNEVGARVRSASAMAVMGAAMDKRDLVIDRPFYLWIERPGVTQPVLDAYLAEGDWRDPGRLER